MSKSGPLVKWAILALLIAGILGRICNIGIYPPFGGVNVYLCGLGVALFLTAACQAATLLSVHRWPAVIDESLPVLPILAASSLLALWAAGVLLLTDTPALKRLLTFALGIGLIGVVWFAVDSAFKVELLLGVVVLGAVVSALYGAAVTIFGDPFMTAWIVLSKVEFEKLYGIIAGGRMAGLSSNINAFSYVLATAVPLAFAFIVSSKQLRTQERTWAYSAALFLALALMLTVLLLNATRSALLGAVGGCVIIGVALLIGRPDLWKRLAVVLALVAAWLLLMFVPGVRGADAILAIGPAPGAGSEDGELEDTWFGKTLARVSQSGWPLDENSPYQVELREKIATARELWRESRADFGLNRRIVGLDDTSARARIPMALTALRYSLEYPLGTGTYNPEPRHILRGLDPRLAEEVLTHFPHNQFMVTLVYYGYPGVVLLIAFYALVGRSLLATARHALRSHDTESLALAAAVTGALAGYGLNSLFHNAGPFVSDWFHFIIVGLVFSIERLAAKRASST